MKKILIAGGLILFYLGISAQSKTENVVIVTLDGFRWQEVFAGADSLLINDSTYVRDTGSLKSQFWASTADQRRKKLLPFLWTTIQTQGQLYGNRWKENRVNNANQYWFSYPGYNEIFTGYPDDSVNSNDKIWNKNENVLEFINRQPHYNNKVAVFATWDVFPYILNIQRSKIFVNADIDTLKFNTPELKLINDMQFLTTKPLGVRPDVFAYFAAREYMKAYKPKVLYVAFDETDDWAHAGRYDQYLRTAHAEDAMISDLWKTLQSLPEYKDKTTVILTCDHGRGDEVKKEWKDHGKKIKDAGQIWIAAIGPDTPAQGEMTTKDLLYQRQIATTIAAILRLDFKPSHPVLKPISTIYGK